jgi:tetratricopeptide (TPR) repeat protein
LSTPTGHLWLTGGTQADRLKCIRAYGSHTLVASTHRNLRGPYTGVDSALRCLLPEAVRRWPELVERHRVELLHGMPRLADMIGPAPVTIATSSPYEQRTRFFHAGMIRPVSNGIVSFLLSYADRVVESGDQPLSVVFEDVSEAELTTTEFLALLVRRANPEQLRVIVSGRTASLPDELQTELTHHASIATAPQIELAAPMTEGAGGISPQDVVRAYVDSDGVIDDPSYVAAYEAANPGHRRVLHDRRAAELRAEPGGGLPTGAIPYHSERGTDPAGAGRQTLLAALQYCVEIGFSAAILDIGNRGRAITDPAEHPKDYCEFTMQTAYAAVDLGQAQQGLDLCTELRRTYADPKVHMSTSYTIAMLYTRFFSPRDHDLAVAWQNNAIALAQLLPDPDDRRLHIGFQDNALALIEMHRGNLAHALDLVQAGIDRLNRELSPEQWVMHRTQLMHNRARLLSALGRLEESQSDYATLIGLDPYYTEYLTDRAKIARRQNDLVAALADYDRAIELAPPFPELHYNRGTARLESGDEDGALEDFDLVLELEPRDLDSRIARVEILVSRAEYDAAEACVKEGLTLQAKEPQLMCALGTIELERGAAALAARCFDGALAVDPNYPAALVNRAVALFRLGKPMHASEDLTRTLQLVGDDPDVLLNRGQAFAAAGNLDEALADFNLALSLPDADISELHRARTKTLERQSRHR